MSNRDRATSILAELGLGESDIADEPKSKNPKPKQMPTGQAPAAEPVELSAEEKSARAQKLLEDLELDSAPKSGFAETELSKSSRHNAVGWKGAALPMAGAALGMYAGPFAAPMLRMGPSGARLLGEMLGGAAGEAANQDLGITEPNPLAIGLNGLSPVVGRAMAGAIQHSPRLLPNSSASIRAGLVERAGEAPGKHIVAPDSQALYRDLPKAGEPGSFRITEMPETAASIKALREQDSTLPLLSRIERRLEGDPVTYRDVKATLPYTVVEYNTTTARLPYTHETPRTSESVIQGPGGEHSVPKARFQGPEGERVVTDKWGKPDAAETDIQRKQTDSLDHIDTEVKYRDTQATLPKEVVKYRDIQARLPVEPKRSPGYEFQEAVNLSEELGQLIRNTSDGEARGAYRRLYRSVLTDLETLPAPAGGAVEQWAKARESYKKEIARNDLTEVIEKASAPKRGVPQLNADQVLKFIQTNKEFRKRLDPKELAGLEKDFANMASFTGPGSNKLLTILAGSLAGTVMGGPGGAAAGATAGYVLADVLSAALLHPGARRVITKIVTAKGGKAGQDTGAILAAALTGALGNDPNHAEE